MKLYCRMVVIEGENRMVTGKLTIAVIGAGNIGGTLGRKWVGAGHPVAFGGNDPNGKHEQTLRSDLAHKATIGSVAQALGSKPDVVVIALPGAVRVSTIAHYADTLDARTIPD